MRPDSLEISRAFESRETGRTIPVLTTYILRHGETTEDKLNPTRGLTPEGEKQMDRAAARLMAELDPKRDIIQIVDSGNHRANVSVMRIAEKLKEAGFCFFTPIRLDSRENFQATDSEVQTTEEPRPRSLKRSLGAANIPDAFKKQLADPLLHQELDIPEDIPDKRIATWMLREWPDEVEKPEAVAGRVERGILETQKRLPQLAKQLGPERRIVTIGAVNASVVDATIVPRTGMPVVDRGGEVANAEGFKVDFSLSKEPRFSVWGEEIEKQLGNEEIAK